jgi:hypothetical protein
MSYFLQECDDGGSSQDHVDGVEKVIDNSQEGEDQVCSRPCSSHQCQVQPTITILTYHI